jgi:uncharacterized protein (TIGR03089 family)
MLTFYDDSTGERVELSGATASNWVSKVANLLVDGLDCQPGDRVGVLLPVHWQTAVILFGAWTAGVGVTNDSTDADIVFAAETALPAALEADPLQPIGLSLRPLGAPMQAIPPGSPPRCPATATWRARARYRGRPMTRLRRPCWPTGPGRQAVITPVSAY